MDVQSSFHNLLLLLKRSFTQLGKDIQSQHLEFFCSTVHQVMTSRDRNFHSEQHIIEMVNSSTTGVETLAIVCHDLVYTQIDKRVPLLLQPLLSEFILDDQYQLILPPPETLQKGHLALLVYEIFGFSAHSKVTPSSGLNEFLSAFAAMRLNRDTLSEWEIAQLVSCIEATIPFRPTNDRGETASDLLATKLATLNKKYNWGKNEADLVATVQMTVDVSNRDVSGFASLNPGDFLTGTWNLIVESNPALRNPLYTVTEYRNALAKMEGFLRSLKPETVFRQYRGAPDEQSYRELTQAAQKNIYIGAKYIQCKLVAVNILHALCSLTGGEATLIIFMGSILLDGDRSVSELEGQLDLSFPLVRSEGLDPEVLKLLKDGRTGASTFDLRHSPIAGYLCERMTRTQVDQVIESSALLMTKRIDDLTYLKQVPWNLLKGLLLSVAKVAETRREKILKLIDLLNK